MHDSFWTHAADVEQMSQILREEFVALYSKPLLLDLAEEFSERYPDIEFPPVPLGGDLQIKEVLDSPYFFS